jgi:hypothetical protein
MSAPRRPGGPWGPGGPRRPAGLGRLGQPVCLQAGVGQGTAHQGAVQLKRQRRDFLGDLPGPLS